MEYVSLPRMSIGSRWQPARLPGAPQLQTWHPAPPKPVMPPSLSSSPGLGQNSTVDVGTVILSSLASTGTAIIGFSLALWGPRDKPTWRWIGGLAGSIGVLRLLHEASTKLKV